MNNKRDIIIDQTKRIFWDVKSILVDKYFDQSSIIEGFIVSPQPNIKNLNFSEEFDKLIMVFLNRILSLVRIFESQIEKKEGNIDQSLHDSSLSDNEKIDRNIQINENISKPKRLKMKKPESQTDSSFREATNDRDEQLIAYLKHKQHTLPVIGNNTGVSESQSRMNYSQNTTGKTSPFHDNIQASNQTTDRPTPIPDDFPMSKQDYKAALRHNIETRREQKMKVRDFQNFQARKMRDQQNNIAKLSEVRDSLLKAPSVRNRSVDEDTTQNLNQGEDVNQGSVDSTISFDNQKDSLNDISTYSFNPIHSTSVNRSLSPDRSKRSGKDKNGKQYKFGNQKKQKPAIKDEKILTFEFEKQFALSNTIKSNFQSAMGGGFTKSNKIKSFIKLGKNSPLRTASPLMSSKKIKKKNTGKISHQSNVDRLLNDDLDKDRFITAWMQAENHPELKDEEAIKKGLFIMIVERMIKTDSLTSETFDAIKTMIDEMDNVATKSEISKKLEKINSANSSTADVVAHFGSITKPLTVAKKSLQSVNLDHQLNDKKADERFAHGWMQINECVKNSEKEKLFHILIDKLLLNFKAQLIEQEQVEQIINKIMKLRDNNTKNSLLEKLGKIAQGMTKNNE